MLFQGVRGWREQMTGDTHARTHARARAHTHTHTQKSTVHHIKTHEVHIYRKFSKTYFNSLIGMKLTKHDITSVPNGKNFWNSLETQTPHLQTATIPNTMHHNEWLPHTKVFWILVSIWEGKCQWNTLVIDCFITCITQTWMIPGMYMVMYLQITCVNKCFITQNTPIWTLPSM
jgi:hypothetical protein